MAEDTTRRSGRRPALVQICISKSRETGQIVPPRRLDRASRDHELSEFRKHLASKLGGLEHEFLGTPRLSPYCVGISDTKHSQLKELHLSLGRAFADIVSRWFSDESARFPERMPLNDLEEKLLRWVAESANLRDYNDRAGCWRTDVLFGKSSDGSDDEAPFICEVNGRLPLNGLLGMGIQAVGAAAVGASPYGSEDVFELGSSLDESLKHIDSYFESTKPLFCIREKWFGVDSRVLLPLFAQRHRQRVAHVSPQDLDVRQDDNSPTGYSLWDTSTDTKIEQWVCELLQSEWESVCRRNWAVGQQLTLTPLNDFRTTMLVHDKRLLGILREEISGMVERGVLSAEAAGLVSRSIPETLTPGSVGLKAVLEESKADPSVRKYYIYKSCRDGSGTGIAMGKDMTQSDWLAKLEHLSSRALRPSEDAAVIQRLVDHHWYDIVRHEVPEDAERQTMLHLIGSMYMFNNKEFYMGPWRTGIELHLGLGPEATGIAMGAVRLPHKWSTLQNIEPF